jgi:hypothetical protein
VRRPASGRAALLLGAFVALAALGARCARGERGDAPPEWSIVPGRSAGPITAASSERELARRLGPERVQAVRIGVGDGETVPGTALFPGDPARRLEVLWQDTVERRRPARLVLRGAGSRWRLPGGVSLGTPLGELERLNGRPFVLAGFGWDYEGVVVDWQGGALAGRLGASVHLYLAPAGERATPAYRTLLGDREFSSALSEMRQLDPRVYQIFVDFD